MNVPGPNCYEIIKTISLVFGVKTDLTRKYIRNEPVVCLYVNVRVRYTFINIIYDALGCCSSRLRDYRPIEILRHDLTKFGESMISFNSPKSN